MLVKYHILFGLVFSIILYLVFPLTVLEASVIFLSSFLIDVDHYLWHIFNKKSMSLKKSIDYFFNKRKKYTLMDSKEREKYKKTILFFHSLEFLIIVLLLSFINRFFLFVFIGLFFHLFLDILEYIYIKEPLYSKLSIILILIKNKNKKEWILN